MDHIKPATDNTCTWLPKHKKFTHWLNLHRGILWITGKPGAGKSTLMKYALQHVDQGQISPQNVLNISFFFDGRGNDLQRNQLGFLRSVLYQMLPHAPSAFSSLVQAFKKKEEKKKREERIETTEENMYWQESELLSFLEDSLPKVLESYSIRIFADALDECGEAIALELIEIFENLISRFPETSSKFGICFTCRHFPILSIDRELEICVDQENTEDISTFVQIQLRSRRLRNSKIGDLIVAKASGVFQWAFLIVDIVSKLDRRGHGIRRIENEIERIPEDLDTLYRQLLSDIREEDRHQSRRLMHWICFAIRPLTLDELRHALVVDAIGSHRSLQQLQDAEEYIEDNDTMERRVIDLSCGLAGVQVIKRKRTVHFIHQSVKDFFVQDGIRILDDSVTTADLATGEVHHGLFRLCIRYIAIEDIDQVQCTSELASKFPFLQYAIRYWAVHAKLAESKDISPVDLLDLLDMPENIFNILQRWISVSSQIVGYRRPLDRTTFRHMMSIHGIVSVLSVDCPKSVDFT